MTRSLVLLLFVSSCFAIFVEKLSFSPPFNSVNENGDREIRGFTVGGDAAILRNFIRLTPDRQSKKGYMWAHNPMGKNEFSAFLHFRISGQGKKLFGDGLAFWLSSSEHYVPGNFHGLTESFTGIGIIFDTFKNSETANLHKDVTIVVNDGTKSIETMLSQSVGCQAAFRYLESRADFSVQNASRARIMYTNRVLRIAIDPLRSGRFEDCAEISDPLPEGWVAGARIGLTGSTGALADNHDVLSLKVFERADTPSPVDEKPSQDSFEHLVQHIEHQLTAVHESLRNNIIKLKDQESQAEQRIQAIETSLNSKMADTLEQRVKSLEDLNLVVLKTQEQDAENRISKLESSLNKQVQAHLSQRIDALENQLSSRMTDALERRIGTLETIIQDKVEQRLKRLEELLSERIKSSVDDVEEKSRGWYIPFLLLSIIVCGGLAFVWWKYKLMQKQHFM